MGTVWENILITKRTYQRYHQQKLYIKVVVCAEKYVNADHYFSIGIYLYLTLLKMVKYLVAFVCLPFVCSFVVYKESKDQLQRDLILKEIVARERLKNSNTPQCYPLSIPICRRLGYNATSARVDIYDSQIGDIHEIAKYLEFFENELCFEDLLFFLCTLFNPICFKNHPKPVLPCRSECRNVKHQCKGTIEKFRLKWQDIMHCHNLPEYESDVCLTRKSIVTAKQFQQQNAAEETHLKQLENTKCPVCKPSTKPPQYKQFAKAGYAIEGQYLSKTKTANGGLKFGFLVKRVFKQGSVPIIKHGIIHLWSNTRCLCSKLEFDHKYILIGQENGENYRLEFDRSTHVIPKNRFWKRLLHQWKRKFRIYVRQQLRI